MSSFNLYIEASVNAVSGADPLLEVLLNGSVVSYLTIDQLTGSGTNTLSATLTFFETLYPSSLSFRFSSSSGDPGDSVTLNTVKINGQTISGSDLSATILSKGQTASVTSTSAIDYVFGKVAPTPSTDFGTPTKVITAPQDRVAGSSGSDIIEGSSFGDRVYGMDDDDAIYGQDGDDQLYGQLGNDILLGGNGNDKLFGNEGDDILYGEDGDDTLSGGTGNDILNGGAGNDSLTADAGDDILYGEDGDDTLIGVSGNNHMYGDAGNDRLLGGNGNDVQYGGADADIISGGAGDDQMYGEDGTDQMVGGAGNDIMSGGADNDVMQGGAGNDEIYGNSGDDRLVGDAGNDTLDGGDGLDILVGGSGSDVIYGGAGNDVLYGHGLDAATISTILRNNAGVVYNEYTNSFYRYVSGGATWAAADTAAQAATLNGTAGHLITITSSIENTLAFSLTGGAEAWIGASDSSIDTFWIWTSGAEAGTQFSTGATATAGFYTNWGGGDPNGDNTINYAILNTAGTWYDRAGTESHGYIIEWDAGLISDDGLVDTLYGGAGNDDLYGFGGADILYGGSGADRIYGGEGDDTIYGSGLNNEATPVFDSGAVFSSYSGAQDGVGTVTLIDGGDGFVLDGNLWKKIALAYTVTANTVIEFDFKSTLQAEISAIGFETNDDYTNDSNRFKIYGDQAGGMGYAAPEATYLYTGNGAWQHYTINVGTYFTGSFSYLTFINDDDGGTNNGNSWYTNIRIYDTGNTDTAANLLIGGNGNDTIFGGTLNDVIQGDAGNDTISGDDGNDTITGGTGADTINGGNGNDTFNLANGDFASGESLTGGAGTDVILFTNAVTVDFTTGTLATIETLTGSAGNDIVALSAMQFAGFTTLNFSGGTDTMYVLAAGDISAMSTPTVSNLEAGHLIGTAGNDSITLTGAQLNAIIVGTGIIDLGAGASDTINLTSTSTDLNTLGATDASILGVEFISAATAGAGVRSP